MSSSTYGSVEWNADGTKFRDPATGAWKPASQFFETFGTPPVPSGAAIPSIGGGAGMPGSFQRPSQPVASTPGTGMAPGGAGGGFWGDVGGKIKDVGSWVLKNPDSILALASLYQGMQQNKRSNQLTNQALASAEERQRMGREAAAGLRKMRRPDLTKEFADPGNPYSRRRIRSVGGG